MCLAIPGKVIEINGDEVIVDYNREKRKVIKIFNVSVGDYVIVFNKIITDIIPKNQAIEYLKLIESNNVRKENERNL